MSKTETTIPLPLPDVDFYQIFSLLSDEERKKLKAIREFMESCVSPV